MSQDAANTNSVVPSRLIGKSLPNEKLFFLLTALECEGVFKANVYKKASALSQNYFTPAALEFSMREWRQEAKKYIAEHGEAAGVEAQSMPMTSGLGKGHAGKRTGAKAGRKRSE